MKKLVILLSIVTMLSFVSAASVSDKLHLQIQTTDLDGSPISGTFNFVFNISTTDNCSSVVYSNSTTKTTDSRGIISYYLENINLPFDEAYYLCYYRDGSLKSNSELVRVPYSFNSKYLGGYDENFFLPLNTSAVGTFSGITSGDSQSLDGYDSSFFMPLNKSVYGTFDFNGGWSSGGLTIQNGSIYADTGYFYNLTSLDVSNLAINGSLFPQEGYDNTFDLGSSSLSWRDLWLGRDLTISSGPDGGINLLSSTSNPTALLYGSDPTGGTGILSLYNGSSLESLRLHSQGDSYFNGGNVGIGTVNPASTLDVNGKVSATDWSNVSITESQISNFQDYVNVAGDTMTGLLTLFNSVNPSSPSSGSIFYNSSSQAPMFYNGSEWLGLTGVPSGMVSFFNLTSCPTGWTEDTLARGRYVVGLPGAGTLEATVGTALSDSENRATGSHTHPITDPGHSHGITSGSVQANFAPNDRIAKGSGTASPAPTIFSATTGITVNAPTSPNNVAGTNAPYIQYLVCVKD